jgi:hypothetical protein
MRVGGLVFLLCCVSLRAIAADPPPPPPPPPQVPPASPNELSGLYDKGATAFSEGRYAEAVRAFEQAYRMKPAASLLFNIARAYDRLFIVDNDEVALQRAIESYREYLAEGKVPRQREAIERLEALTFIQAKRKPTPAPTPPPAVQYPTYPPQVYQPLPMPVYVAPPRVDPVPPSVRDPYSTYAPTATPPPAAKPAPKPALPATPPPPAPAAEPKKPAVSSSAQKPAAKKGGELEIQWVPATTFLRGGP